MKSKLAIFFFIIASIYIVCNRDTYKTQMFTADATGYYMYLPAVFIYHDLGNLGFYPKINREYDLTGNMDDYGIFPQPTGKRTNKYPAGTAIFEMPFFLLAHAYCLIFEPQIADGYSVPYITAGISAYIFWVAFGLLLLRNFLRRYFDDNIIAFTILAVAFGTNIYCYTLFIPGYTHPFSFFLFAAVLLCTNTLYATGKGKYFYWLGLLLGLVIIIRPVNIAIAVIPLLWDVYNRQTLIARFRFFITKFRDVAVGAIIFFLVALIQMGYWKYTSGSWIHYSYEGEGFNFLRPRIWPGLFSYQKGWFVYTPIAFVAMTGLMYLWIKERKKAPSIFIFFALIIYLVFSWRQWIYGGGFSARPMVETIPVAAFPLAFITDSIYKSCRGLAKKIAYTALMLLLTVLNLFQTYQYSIGTIFFEHMNRAYYWRVFGKVRATDEDRKLMMTEEEIIQQRVDWNK